MKNDDIMLTVSQVLNKMRERGIENELKMNENNAFFVENTDVFYTNPKELEIVKIYRFEGDSNPDDNAIIYIIRDMHGEKFFLLDAYGAKNNMEEEFINFLREIPVNETGEH